MFTCCLVSFNSLEKFFNLCFSRPWDFLKRTDQVFCRIFLNLNLSYFLTFRLKLYIFSKNILKNDVFSVTLIRRHARMCAKLLQSCLNLCNPMDCSPAGSSVHQVLWSGLPCPPPGDLQEAHDSKKLHYRWSVMLLWYLVNEMDAKFINCKFVTISFLVNKHLVRRYFETLQKEKSFFFLLLSVNFSNHWWFLSRTSFIILSSKC